MRENDFVNNEVMPHLRIGDNHVVHVQNSAESGTPDVQFSIFPASGWIETKVAKSGWLYFETFQIPWFRKRARSAKGFGVWVLARIGSEIHLYLGTQIVDTPRETYKKWVRCKVSDLPDPIVRLGSHTESWSGIIAALTDPSQFTSQEV